MAKHISKHGITKTTYTDKIFYFIFIFRKNVAANKIGFLQNFGECPEGGFENQLVRCKFSIFRQG